MVAEQTVRYPRSTYRITAGGSLEQPVALSATNLRSHEGRPFRSLWELLAWIERDIDANGYPQKMFKYRTWGRGATPMPENETLEVNPTPEAGETGSTTFIVQVLCRQNATWQGTIQWVDRRQTLTFRSEFEMLRLMDEAVRANEASLEATTPAWVK